MNDVEHVADAIRQAWHRQMNVVGALGWEQLAESERRRWMDLGAAAVEATVQRVRRED